MKTLTWILLAATVCTLPTRASHAQYMYLDTNGNGISDASDGLLNYPAPTTVAIWLRTNVGRDGLPDLCASNSTIPLSINSYEIALRLVSGSVSWGARTNLMSTFTTDLGVHSTPRDYHFGYGASTPLPAGTYQLATLSVQSTNNLIVGRLALQARFDASYGTTFGSECFGRDFDNTLKLGSDWVDADPLYTPSEWTPNGVALSPYIEDEGRVSIASDGAGGAFIAFEVVAQVADTDIYVHRVDSRGTLLWSLGGHPACTNGSIQAYPEIIADGSGGCIVTWQDSRGATPPDIYAQRLLSDGSIAPGWNSDGNSICTAAANQLLPQICSDGTGGAFITWKDARNGTWDVYAQRVTPAGVQPTGWPANVGLAITTVADHQIDSRIVPDGAGGVIIAWQDDNGGNIYAQRMSAGGAIAPGWAANGVPICLAAGSQQQPELCTDLAGGAIIAWHDTRSGPADIYAQRILASGATAWATDGIALCTATNAQANVTVADAGGGAIVAWEDQRGTNTDIYAQTITSSGDLDPRWPANGDTVCIAAGDQVEPRIAPDGANGAVISWEDGIQTDNANIFVQRVTPEGKALYGQSGRSVCSAILNQRHPRIAPDGVGGALVAWEDFRSGTNFDPYVMRIAPQGGDYVTAVESGERSAPAVRFLPNVPNPFNPETKLRFVLAEARHVTLTIVDPRGGAVAELANRRFESGRHEVRWAGRDTRGIAVASGVYLAVLRTGSIERVHKLVLAK